SRINRSLGSEVRCQGSESIGDGCTAYVRCIGIVMRKLCCPAKALAVVDLIFAGLAGDLLSQALRRSTIGAEAAALLDP
ncbi:MAG: hypothetical protein VCE75_15815, partial [Alphaproteobacteria bacterium]